LNVCARFLGALLGIDHALDKPFRRIVVSKYVGLGSIIQATPLLQTLRKRYPEATIVFVSTEGNETLLKHIPEIDAFYGISDRNLSAVIRSSFALLRKLWKFKPELYIDLEFYSHYSTIITTFSKATNRLGFQKKDKPYRKGIFNYLVPFDTNTPISEAYLQFSRLLGATETVSQLKIEINPEAREGLEAKTGLSFRLPYIVINPNASDLRLERRWPAENFIATIEHFFLNYPGYQLVLIGNKAEAPYAGKINLSELILLIANAELMVTNDTGPMHIAYATGTKTISLFGPCSPLQYGGFRKGIALYKHVSCSPCVHTHLIPPCKGNNTCMKLISVAEVKDASNQLLNPAAAAHQK
jgi:ADP-heptose:LPS heptosyltransferase